MRREGAVAASAPDAGVAAHYGSPVPEQRALQAGRGVVDLSHRAVVTVTGPDRLTWLNTLSSQQLDQVPAGHCTELLLLEISGRIEHAPAVVDDGETAWLITEAAHGPVLAQWLDSMRFFYQVEVADRTAEFAVLGSTAPLPVEQAGAGGAQADVPDEAPDHGLADSLAGAPVVWHDPWPQLAPGAESYAAVADAEHPGHELDWYLSLVPRGALTDTVTACEQAGWTLAGVWAAEALRVAAWRPRLAFEVDAKSIPHELDLIRTAVHLNKGCYKGQETIARVHNLGHPPRRLVFLHLDGSEHTLPQVGADVLAPQPGADIEAMAADRAVGTVTSVARHHEAGPIALAVVKRKVDPEAQLVVREALPTDDDDAAADAQPGFVFYAAAQELVVRPDAGQAVGRPKGDFVRAPRRR